MIRIDKVMNRVGGGTVPSGGTIAFGVRTKPRATQIQVLLYHYYDEATASAGGNTIQMEGIPTSLTIDLTTAFTGSYNYTIAGDLASSIEDLVQQEIEALPDVGAGQTTKV